LDDAKVHDECCYLDSSRLQRFTASNWFGDPGTIIVAAMHIAV
jgi:hypothetical protein